MHTDYFAAPAPDDTPEEKVSFATWLASLQPKQALASLYTALIQAGGQLCAFSGTQLEAMLANLTDGPALVEALKACPCSSCTMKADYIKEAGPFLIDAVKRVSEIHRVYVQRAEAIQRAKQEKEKVRSTVGNELCRLKQAGRLGLS